MGQPQPHLSGDLSLCPTGEDPKPTSHQPERQRFHLIAASYALEQKENLGGSQPEAFIYRDADANAQKVGVADQWACRRLVAEAGASERCVTF